MPGNDGDEQLLAKVNLGIRRVRFLEDREIRHGLVAERRVEHPVGEDQVALGLEIGLEAGAIRAANGQGRTARACWARRAAC